MVDLAMGLSIGVELNARVTKIVQVGLGSYSGDWIGLKEGRLTMWEEERVEMGLLFLYYQELYREGGSLLTIIHPHFDDQGYHPYMNDLYLLTDRGVLEAGLTANLIFIGVDAAIDVSEITDFFLGWVGMDILDDDCYSRSLEELVMQVRSRNARKRAVAVQALRQRTGQNFCYIVVTPEDLHTEEQVDAWRAWDLWLKEQNR